MIIRHYINVIISINALNSLIGWGKYIGESIIRASASNILLIKGEVIPSVTFAFSISINKQDNFYN